MAIPTVIATPGTIKICEELDVDISKVTSFTVFVNGNALVTEYALRSNGEEAKNADGDTIEITFESRLIERG